MNRKFFMGRVWRVMLLVNVALPMALGLGPLLGGLTWWRITAAIALAVVAAVQARFAWIATRRPLIVVSADDVVFRSMYERTVRRVPRAEIKDVAWANPGAMCLRLQSGESLAVPLHGLSHDHKDAIRYQVQEWASVRPARYALRSADRIGGRPHDDDHSRLPSQ
jgi:hypothetical protein